MASLWQPFRLLPRLQSTLSQPLGLRACTPLQTRLLHSSPILHARKPSKAIVKPKDAPAPTSKRQQREALRKQQEEVERLQSQRLASTTSATPTHSHTPPPTTHHPVAITTSQRHVTVKRPAEAISTAPSPPSPLAPTLGYMPGGRSGVTRALEDLASAESPLLIYEATKARQYVAWCIFASLLFGGLTAVQVGFFTTDPSKSNFLIATTFLLTGLIWATFASWTAYGANDVIKRIWAIPSATGKPLLRIEPVKLLFGQRPLPFDVPLGRVFTDRGFENSIASYNATRRPKSGLLLDALFGPIRTLLSANSKMCTRKASFAQLRVAEMGNWKVDIRDCNVADGGRSMFVSLPNTDTTLLTAHFSSRSSGQPL